MHFWKKREAWISTAWKILGAQSVNRWTKFLWSDVKLLRSLARVFKKVIYPQSNRQASVLFPNVVKDPASWQESTPKEKHSRKTTPKDESESKKTTGVEIDLTSSKPIIFLLGSSSDEEDNDDATASTTPNVSDLKTCVKYDFKTCVYPISCEIPRQRLPLPLQLHHHK